MLNPTLHQDWGLELPGRASSANRRPAGIRRLASRSRVGLAALLLAACCAFGSSPETTNAVVQPNVLRPNDAILVRVYQEDDLETKAVLDKDGRVTLPLLGPVELGKKTPEEAAAFIRELYAKDYLVNPQVSLSVTERAKLRFTVMGQVQRPGTYEFPANESLNLLQGLAMAGGYTRIGAPSKVTLQRVQNGRPVILRLNAELMATDKKAKPLELLPDDIIMVGERIF